MHDLNTINRVNAEAHAADINAARRQGKHVVGYFDGLHLMGFVAYNTAAEAAKIRDHLTVAGERRVVYEPIKPAYDRGTARAAALRDQSEDRRQPYSLEQLAALGRRSVGDPAPAFV